MKTGIDCSQDVLSVINISSITDLIDGNIYLFQRPKNSKKEDIVVGTLVISNDQLQQGVVNVNFHCPNKSGVTMDDQTDNSLPDISKMKLVGNALALLLNNHRGLDFFFEARNTGIPLRDETNGNWFVNIRVDYHSIQYNYTNI